MALRLRGRALVDQQVAEIYIGVAQVIAENVLAEVLEEELARRGLPVELAALVPWTGESDVGFAIVGRQPAEEGW
jgi:hypothetical protein